MIQSIKALTTKDLLSVHNALLNKETKRFASRAKGEAQTIGAAKVAGPAAVKEVFNNLRIVVEKASTPAPKKVAQPKVKKLVNERLLKPAGIVIEKAPKKASRKGTNLQPVGGRTVPCRAGTKQSILLDQLARPEGATMTELLAALSDGKPWVEATVRSGFGWDMKNKGYGVRSEFDSEGVERFFIIVPEGFEVLPHTERKTKTK